MGQFKNFFQLTNILFYLLSIIIFFFVGMMTAAFSGAAEGQGLAGGAIIFSYGILTAGLAFIASLFLVKHLDKRWIILINKIFLIITVILITSLFLRYQSQHNKNQQTSYLDDALSVSTAYAANHAICTKQRYPLFV